MRTKIVDIGKITGLSSYEAAVLAGKFTGTYEEFLDKEMKAYNDMKEYADNAKCEMDEKIANLSKESNLTELIDARANFTTLKQRLDNFDVLINTIIDRLSNSLGIDGEVIDNAFISESGYLTLMVGTKDGEEGTGNCKCSSGGMIEIRHHGAYIQWRYIGYTNWFDLFCLDDIIPKFKIGKCQFVNTEEEAGAYIGGSLINPTLNLKIPRGKAGLNGGDILNARVNDKGELILTVTNSDYIKEDENGNKYITPVFSVGEVKTLESNEQAYVIMGGTVTNPILNFGIPKGSTVKNVTAEKDENGLLHFNFES